MISSQFQHSVSRIVTFAKYNGCRKAYQARFDNNERYVGWIGSELTVCSVADDELLGLWSLYVSFKSHTNGKPGQLENDRLHLPNFQRSRIPLVFLCTSAHQLDEDSSYHPASLIWMVDDSQGSSSTSSTANSMS